jgi:hypothetical protein
VENNLKQDFFFFRRSKDLLLCPQGKQWAREQQRLSLLLQGHGVENKLFNGVIWVFPFS